MITQLLQICSADRLARPFGLTFAEALPYSLRGVRDSLLNSGTTGPIVWIGLVVIFSVVAVLVIWYIRTAQRQPQQIKQRQDDPAMLFESLLETVEMPKGDKELLRQMTKGSRLRQPAMCLLSPSLMARTKQLWQDEQGEKIATPAKMRQIDQITVRLHDHIYSAKTVLPLPKSGNRSQELKITGNEILSTKS